MLMFSGVSINEPTPCGSVKEDNTGKDGDPLNTPPGMEPEDSMDCV